MLTWLSVCREVQLHMIQLMPIVPFHLVVSCFIEIQTGLTVLVWLLKAKFYYAS